MYDYNPWDPVERAEAWRDEIIGLRTTLERGFLNSEWQVKNTKKGNFPTVERTFLDFLLFRNRWYKSSKESPEEYITGLISGSHCQPHVFEEDGLIKIIRGIVCLEFAIDDFSEETHAVRLGEGLDTKLKETRYKLSYQGWKNIKISARAAVPNPTMIKFLDTCQIWMEYADAFSNHYEK